MSQPSIERYVRFLTLQEAGESISAIGEQHGISRQRVHQILKRGMPRSQGDTTDASIRIGIRQSCGALGTNIPNMRGWGLKEIRSFVFYLSAITPHTEDGG